MRSRKSLILTLGFTIISLLSLPPLLLRSLDPHIPLYPAPTFFKVGARVGEMGTRDMERRVVKIKDYKRRYIIVIRLSFNGRIAVFQTECVGSIPTNRKY